MVTFSHLDQGTPEAEWQRAFASHRVATADLGVDELVVVAAHPDDESLGVAGLAHRISGRGGRVRIVIATNGENSHPLSPTHTSSRLAELRRDEVLAATARVSPAASVRLLGIRDGALDDAVDRLRAAVEETVTDAAASGGRVLVVAPWEGDGHHDHRIVGSVAREIAAAHGVRYRGYPIWLWHWGATDDAPWSLMEMVPLDSESLRAKRDAIAAHASQVEPLSAAAGDEAILHAGMRAHFSRPFDILVRAVEVEDVVLGPESGSTSREHFEAFFARHADPWGFDSRWYEQRKRELLLATLPRARYSAGLELGCANGVLTERLADRCDDLLAVDFADAAVAAARVRLRDHANVRFATAALPVQWPEGSFDLIVFSEIGYYWDAPALETAIERMAGSLTSGGHLVACHWRHRVPENPVTGDGVHVALRTRPGLRMVAFHQEEDFLLEVFATDAAVSVARETGMIA